MASITMSVVHPALRTSSPTPYVSSPLAASSRNSSSIPSRTMPPKPSFPHSRPLRPFVSISQNSSSSNKPVKFIEPPKNFKTVFVLDLTQGELSRQD